MVRFKQQLSYEDRCKWFSFCKDWLQINKKYPKLDYLYSVNQVFVLASEWKKIREVAERMFFLDTFVKMQPLDYIEQTDAQTGQGHYVRITKIVKASQKAIKEKEKCWEKIWYSRYLRLIGSALLWGIRMAIPICVAIFSAKVVERQVLTN